ncbi:hypothetical protein [Methylobacterium sp. P5_C11]
MARKQPDPIFAAIATHREAHEEWRAEVHYRWTKRRTRLYSIPVSPLRWSGRGNVIAAAGTALINLLERA